MRGQIIFEDTNKYFSFKSRTKLYAWFDYEAFNLILAFALAKLKIELHSVNPYFSRIGSTLEVGRRSACMR